MSVQTIEVGEGEAGARLDRWFKRRYPHLTHGRLEKLLRTGQIRVDGARAKANTRLSAGQAVRVPPSAALSAPEGAPKAKPVSAKDAAFVKGLVIHEDDWLIAFDKPAGLAVQGGSKTTRHLDGLLEAFATDGERPRLAHRLDRDTSGVLVVGKTPVATAALARAFQSHRAQKTYWALTAGAPRPLAGEAKGFLKKAGPPGQEKMVPARHGEPGAQHARTLYVTLAQAGPRAAFLALRPLTGRTHQLRAHMSLMETAILGDPKYRTERETPQGLPDALMLHARALALPHPSGKGTLRLQAEPPAHMVEAFDALGIDPREADEDPFAGWG